MMDAMSEYEITALVMSEHDAFRRAFTDLENADDLSAAWEELAARLEVHAVAEERLFYPVLADEADDGAEDGKEAVREHNAIRHAVADVAGHDLGSSAWWESVGHAQQVNGDHMAEEEREFIPEFKNAVDAERRDQLGLEWLRLHDEHAHAQGLPGDDADPQAVVDSDPPL
jgi:hemerythrin HHE cation binding domain-containing protein